MDLIVVTRHRRACYEVDVDVVQHLPVALNISFYHAAQGYGEGAALTTAAGKLQRFDRALNGASNITFLLYCFVELFYFYSVVILDTEQKAVPLRQIPLVSFVSFSVIQRQPERK